VICEPSHFVFEQRNVFGMLQGLGYRKELGKGNWIWLYKTRDTDVTVDL